MKDGTHLILDLKDCKESKKLLDEKFIKNFLLELVKIIKMKPLTRPKVLYYEHGEKEESGVTGFIIISDSHISVHTYPFKKSLYFDLFSCKKFDSEKVINYLEETFKPGKTARKLLITR